jgi:hypothetical protein
VWQGQGVPPGGGRPVLLIPGYLAGDGSLGLMTQWLRRAGYRTRSSGTRFNVDCSAVAVERIEERLEGLVERHSQRASRSTPRTAGWARTRTCTGRWRGRCGERLGRAAGGAALPPGDAIA